MSIGLINLQAEAGMTWEEWCDTDYNTIGCYVDSDLVSIVLHDGDSIINGVESTDEIIQNGEYEAIPKPPPPPF